MRFHVTPPTYPPSPRCARFCWSASGNWRGDVIMDGRDIGTVVLPGADVKLFLTASAQDRARRRFAELQQRGQETDYETVLRDIRKRDENDTRRAAAPLRQAEDALLVDTTGNTLEESFQVLLQTIKERLQA